MKNIKSFQKWLMIISCITITVLISVSCKKSEILQKIDTKELEETNIKFEDKKPSIESTVENELDEDSVCRKNETEDPLFIFDENDICISENLLSDVELVELVNMISLTYDDLLLEDTTSMLTISINEDKWNNIFIPLLKSSEESDINTFINETSYGFEIANQAIANNDYTKLEQARAIFYGLKSQLPSVVQNVKIMLEDIKTKLLYLNHEDLNIIESTPEEATVAFETELVTPAYLPERFKYYGTFVQGDCGIGKPAVRQVWYDADKFEMLLVTQVKHDGADSEGYITFTDGLESPGGKIIDIFSWAKYQTEYIFDQNGIYVQGYMLVNNENNQEEYNKILYSLKK